MSWGWCQAGNLDWKSFLEGSGYHVCMCSWVCWPSGLLLKPCGFTPCPRFRHSVSIKPQGRTACITLLCDLHPFREFWQPKSVFSLGSSKHFQKDLMMKSLLIFVEIAWRSLFSLSCQRKKCELYSSNVIPGSQHSNSSSHIKCPGRITI